MKLNHPLYVEQVLIVLCEGKVLRYQSCHEIDFSRCSSKIPENQNIQIE